MLLIVANDLGDAEMSCQNANTDIPTPHIDAASARFTDRHVIAPFCAASQVTLAKPATWPSPSPRNWPGDSNAGTPTTAK